MLRPINIAAFAGGFSIVALLYGAALYLPWCQGESCTVQGWLSATSGWFGLIAALIAVALTWRQIAQQQKQTDFLLGDADPTIDVVPDINDPGEIVVRIVNWNRRAVFIRTIGLNVGNATAAMELKLDGAEVPMHKVRWPLYIRGWENRNGGGPHTFQMKISASDNNELIRDWPRNAAVHADIQMLDATHRLERLSASVCA